MKYITLGFLLFLAYFTKVDAQTNPVNWSYEVVKVSDLEYELVFTATIDEGWYVYSQFLEDGGPIPTSIQITEQEGVELVEDAMERGDKKEGYDAMFEMDVVKYATKMELKQTIKVAKAGMEISGFVEYMTCNDHQCLPPTEMNFETVLK